MSKIKTRNNWVFVAFCAFGLSAIISVIINNSVFAASAGVITDANGTRWEYVFEDADGDEPQKLSIKFFDKTPSATTVTVPSFENIKSLVAAAGVTLDANLDTYFLKNGNREYQQSAYPSVSYREPTATTTKLDMSNTSKIQILGVKPIIDPEVETELVFGPNMVIGNDVGLKIWAPACAAKYYSNWNEYYCEINENGKWIEGLEDLVPGWNNKTDVEKKAFSLSRAEAMALTGCIDANTTWISNGSSYGDDPCFIPVGETRDFQFDTSYTSGAAFGGYKLKLTNFSAENFNYIGWNAFKDSTFNAANTSITISGDIYGGSFIFQNTNVKNIIINTANTGAGLFKDCQHIESVTYSNGVDTIVEDTFAGTNLTSFDFGANGIKRIKARAFEGARLEEIDLTGVERLDYRAFRNNDIVELYLPKSINYLQVEVFKGNGNMKKITVAYDTLTSGTTHPLFEVLGNSHESTKEGEPENSVEELNIIAPYAADEQVSATHLTMDDYVYHYDKDMNYHEEEVMRASCGAGSVSSNANYWAYMYSYSGGYNCGKQATEPEKRWAKPDEKKNVIAPLYFANFYHIKRIIVGDGYEYIGGSAFIDLTGSSDEWGFQFYTPLAYCDRDDLDCSSTSARRIEKISLPDSLKGVGIIAFGSAWYPGMEVTIPRNIEYIGQGAFNKMYTLEIDVDFPNLKFLGDDAFTSTLVRNIHLYDKLEYMGWYVFHQCPGIRDVTFDLDFFNPDNLILAGKVLVDDENWSKIGSGEGNTYKKFIAQFGGEGVGRWDPSEEKKEEWGLNYSSLSSMGYRQRYGKITFTEKAVTAPYVQSANGYRYSGIINTSDEGYGQDMSMSGPTGHYFGQVNASEVDFGATPWKAISPFIFHHGQIGKLTLPSGVETIGAMAFTDA